MNRKSEEKLIKLAFGDVNPDEARRIEAEAANDPDAARVLSSYREISSGLRGCAEVPANQLSKERLREAILAQGLAPKRTSAFPTWLWMPGLAAAAAFAFVAFRPHAQSTNPSVVASLTHESTSEFAAPDLGKGLDFGTSNVVTKSDLPTVTAKSPSVQTVAMAETHKKPHRFRHQANRKVSESSALKGLVAAIVDQGENAATLSSAPKAAGGAMPDSALKADAQKPAEPTSIVLIDDQKDAQTGAQRATEVSSRNVIVGG